MTIVAPYSYVWSVGNTSSYAIDSLMTAVTKIGLKSAIAAFVVGDGLGGIWATTTAAIPDMKAFTAQGGYLILSCGGANSPFIWSGATAQSLYTLLKTLIQETGASGVDWDIEGAAVQDTASIAVINAAVVLLQKDNPALWVSYTLPVQSAQYGALPASEIGILKSAVAAGVNLSAVNAMTMDLYANPPVGSLGQPSWGSAATAILDNMVTQMAPIWPTKTTAQLYSMVGCTPMIGENDDGTIFTLADAQTITTYAEQKGLALLSWWSLNRDQANESGGLATSTLVTQANFAYYNVFIQASSGTPTPSPTPTPTPTPTPSAPAWTVGTTYIVGAEVTYNSVLYQCLQKHTSQADWDPLDTPSLWKALGSGSVTPVVAGPTYPTSVSVPMPTLTSGKVVKTITFNNVVATFTSTGSYTLGSGTTSSIVYNS